MNKYYKKYKQYIRLHELLVISDEEFTDTNFDEMEELLDHLPVPESEIVR